MQKAVTRRNSIAALLAISCAGHSDGLAQQGKFWRIGYLTPGGTSSPGDAALLHAFTDQLEKLGYVEGKNLAFIHRAAEGNNGRLNELANELVALKLDAIIASRYPRPRRRPPWSGTGRA
jgi:putative tryptophan/tyrosine transport system substrate-binding protein